MAENIVSLKFEDEKARTDIRDWEDDLTDGTINAVDSLSVLAEKFMKEEAPDGAGFDPPSLSASIDTVSTRAGLRKRVQPFKRARGGSWPLVRAVVGNPHPPVYLDQKPPIDPLLEWASAKLGDAELAYPIREAIFNTGHRTFPNRFVDRSFAQWRDTAEEVAGDAVRDALGGTTL